MIWPKRGKFLKTQGKLGTLGGVNRPFSLVVGIVLLGVIAYLVYEYRADFGLGGSGGGASAGAGQTPWQTIDRSADGFTVQMPAPPSETQVPAYTDHGVVEQVPMIEATVAAQNGGADTTFAVAWADNPPVEQAAGDDGERTLQMAREGALGRTETSLVSESTHDHDGYKIRDFMARNAGGGILDGRLILSGTHLYMLLATHPSASARRDVDVNRFYDSFKLTGTQQ